MNSTSLLVLVQRLDRLERESRGWRIVGITLVGVLAAVLLMGTTEGKVADELRAKRFVLVDSKGNPRAGIILESDESATVNLYGKDRRSGARIGVRGDGSMGLSLFGPGGKPHSGLVVQADGSTALALSDKEGRLRALFGVESDGTPTLQLNGKDGKVIWKAP